MAALLVSPPGPSELGSAQGGHSWSSVAPGGGTSGATSFPRTKSRKSTPEVSSSSLHQKCTFSLSTAVCKHTLSDWYEVTVAARP